MKEKKRIPRSSRTYNMILTALFAAVIAVCSWMSVPSVVPFTLQTFAVFMALGLLGGKNGLISVLVYILLGIVGAPVFSGFKGGVGVIAGATGGYIVGFIFTALVYWLITSLAGNKLAVKAAAMAAGLIVCYLFGTLWFVWVYSKGTGGYGFMGALSLCVFPFVIPDILKLAAALLLSHKLKKHMTKRGM